MRNIFLGLALSWLVISGVAAHQELDSIKVLSQDKLGLTEETTPTQPAAEIDDLIKQEAFVNNSSFGAKVGRPTIKGLRGNQVNIIHNDGALGDVSALSSDHAVALVPLTTKRVEVLSGVRSLLYGSGINGVRLIDRMDLEEDSQLGNFGELHVSGTSNTQEAHLGAIANLVGEELELLVAGDHRNSRSYKAGKNTQIANSQIKSTQGQIALRYKPDLDNRFQLYLTDLDRSYGVPNPNDPVDINMRHKKYGLQWLGYAPTEKIDLIKLDLSYQDYLHDEMDDGAPEGLFGLDTWQARFELEAPIANWTATWVANLETQDLKVCHSHDGCYGFNSADQSGPQGTKLDSHNGYSHADPLPNSKTHQLNLASFWEKDINWFADNPKYQVEGVFSWAANIEYRSLETNPLNIAAEWQDTRNDYYADQNDWAFSLASAWDLSWNQAMQWQIDLSYKERLPSAEELYWEGIDHAADSYYKGDYQLKKERSANLELANLWQLTNKQSLKSRGFYSYFSDYIYQQDLGIFDPFHGDAPVYKTSQKDAYFWGGSLTHKWQFAELLGQPLELTNQIDLVQARLISGGFVPRIAPAVWNSSLEYQYKSWQAELNLKTQTRAEQTARQETTTSGHSLLGFYLAWEANNSAKSWEIWLKGENLLDAEAYDHTSFLKYRAPQLGRNFEAGISLMF